MEPAAGTGGEPPMVEKMNCTSPPIADKFSPGYTDPADPQVQQLVNSMTNDQKYAQMQGTDPGGGNNYDDTQRSPDDTQNNIRGFKYRDGPRGVNLDARQEGREYLNNYSTVFPVTIARGASFDLELEWEVGQAQGDETAASENTLILAPCMNLLRHPAWGRSQETYGEDVWHQGRIASAYTVGVQQFVVACAKHYTANNIEDQRASLNAQMDEQTLREIYTGHFRMVVQDGGVGCIMAAYNSVNGTKSTQNRHTLTEILRDDMGYRGFVITDWWAMPSGQSVPGASAAQNNAAEAVDAGLDIELPWNMNFAQLPAIVDSGRIDIGQINTSVSRILEQKFRFNSARIDGPFGLNQPTTSMSQGSIVNNDQHIDLSRKAAVRSMVLVKNDAATLPIPTDGSVSTVAVIGANVPYTLRNTTPTSGTINFAVDQPLGDRGSSRVNPDPSKTIGPTAGMTQVGGNYGVTIASGNEASVANGAQLAVVVVGLTPQNEGEEYQSPDNGDRSSFGLGGGQDDLVSAVAATGVPTVVVIEAGGTVAMPWLDQVAAVVHAWYPGQQGGLALAQLLFGEENFGGKLPVTWANNWNELPTFNEGTTTNMDYYFGYRYYDVNGITPLFPFGHGLSYTTFEYSNLQVPCLDVTPDGVVDVQVDVTNTGAVAGDEVAFMFVAYPNSPDARRSAAGYKELKGFYRVQLDPGVTKRITMPLRVKDIRRWDMSSNAWVTDSGAVQVMVGPSAANLPLMDTVTIL